MPSKNGPQHRLMEGAAHSPAIAKKAGVPQKVGKEFVAADKKAGKKFDGPAQMARAQALRGSKDGD